MAAYWPELLVVASTLGGAVLRFVDLGQRSFWLDEVIGAESARLGSLFAVLAWDKSDNEAPLYPVLEWLAGHLRQSEAALRSPAALAGILTIPAVYLLARSVAGRPAAGVSALIVAASPFGIWYSQEARAYSFLALFCTLQLLFAVRSARDFRLTDLAGLAVFSALTTYTDYLGALTTFLVYLYVLVSALATAHRDPPLTSRLRGLVDSAALWALLYAPWLQELAIQAFKSSAVTREDGFRTAGWTVLWGAFDITPLTAALLLVGVAALIWRYRQSRDGGPLLLALWLVVPALLIGLEAKVDPLRLRPRYLSLAVPDLQVVIALGAVSVVAAIRRLSAGWRNPSAWPALAAGALMILILAPYGGTLVYRAGAAKDNYRAAAQEVGASGPSALVLTAGNYWQWLYQGLPYYGQRFNLNFTLIPANDPAAISSYLASHPHASVWVTLVNGYDPSHLRALHFIADGTAFSSVTQLPSRPVRIQQMVGVTLVRTEPGTLTAAQQAAYLVAWAQAEHLSS